MAYVIINNNRYDIPEVDFDAICELEENGINLLQQDKNYMKIMTMTRGLCAWVMGCDTRTASKELEAHVQNGGNLIDIFNRVTEAINNSSFFNQGGRKQPQDHKVKQMPSQPNRAQRHRNNKNRRNGNHSQR